VLVLNQYILTRFGLLLTLCTGANFPSLFRSFRYIFRLDPSTKKQTLPSPPFLKHSVVFLTFLLVLSYVISSADAWFHASSQSTIVESTHPLSNSLSTSTNLNVGREINMTRCNDPRSIPSSSIGQQTCGLLSGGSGGDGATRAEGLRTLSGSSSFNKVVFAQEETYILVPASLLDNATYTAKSVGVRTTCARYISKQFCLCEEKLIVGDR
jgi:hypothetical protein